MLIDNWTRQRRGEAFFASGTEEEKVVFEVKAGVVHDIHIHFVNVRGPADGDEDEILMDSNPGIRIGGAPVIQPDEEMEYAAKLAKEADVAVVVVGLNSDWESEGYDRTTLGLPGRTDELVSKVAAANKNTVVVTQSVSCLISPPRGVQLNSPTATLGVFDHHALGQRSVLYRACLVSRELDRRSHRRRVVRESEPVGKDVADVPEAPRRHTFLWPLPY